MNAVPADRRNAEFRVGEWLVRPSLNQLSRGGTVLHLRPKAMDVLVYLAARGTTVVSKDEVIKAIWAKQFLADSALSRAVCELRQALGDEAQRSTYIQTIPKRGYRLITAVRQVEPAMESAEPPREPAPHRVAGDVSRRRSAPAGLSALLLLLTAWVTGHEARPSVRRVTPPLKRVLVLPFENLGPARDDYLAVGITEEITGRLSAVREFAVISSGSAARLAPLVRSTTQAAQEAGADYLLAGTVRWDREPSGRSRVRVTPRLVRVSDDTQVWAEVYDAGNQDILRVQSEIARSVVAEIGIALAEPQRRAAGTFGSVGQPAPSTRVVHTGATSRL
jgi:DNA-binding winged helix-turn-helix (wHTH) protein/TolB-like protein